MAWSGGFDNGWQTQRQFTHGIQAHRNQGFTKPTRMTASQQWPTTQQQTDDGSIGIRDLQPGMHNTVIVGVLIARESPKSFASKKNPGTERHCMSLTVRDTAVDFINCTCWGSENYINDMSKMIHIGDTVEITNPQIASKPPGGVDEKFRPSTPVDYQINISENYSNIKLSGNSNAYKELHHIPIRATNDFYTLADVINNGQTLHQEHINLLFAIKSIGVAKDITTKLGKHLKRCELKIYDETCQSFPLVFWDEELITLANMWTPKENVVFATDVKVIFDDYRKSMIANANGKTVFTTNPDTQEAHSLYQYSQTVQFTSERGGYMDEDGDIDLETITTVYSIGDIKSITSQAAGDNETQYCIVYGYLSMFNIDLDTRDLVTIKCKKCRMRVDRNTGCCSNSSCPAGALSDPFGLDIDTQDVERSLDIGCDITDSSGTLSNVRFGGAALETCLGYMVDEFMCLQDKERTDLKWKYLLERCKFHIKVTPPSFERPRPHIRILSCGAISEELFM